MSDGKSSTTGLSARLFASYHLAIEIETCDRAIAAYAKHGISGTLHDIEHHQMRDAAAAKLKEQLSCLSLQTQ